MQGIIYRNGLGNKLHPHGNNQNAEGEFYMITYDAIVIGFGKGGKTIAGELAARDWRVALIEKSPEMYGGTCINIACIPTKVLVHDGIHGIPYDEAIARKDEVVEKLREVNYNNLADNEHVTIYDAEAAFRSDKEIVIEVDGKEEVLTAEHIFINTGAKNNIPPLEGDLDSDLIYTSTSLIERHELPERLIIVGGGYIGLEYASMYQNFGADVIVIVPDEELMPAEDRDIAETVKNEMQNNGIEFVFGAKAEKVTDKSADEITVTLASGAELTGNAVLLATGRKPNVEGLGLDQTAIELADDGGIKVDDSLQTTVENVWALGDVKGGMQFTYTSLDDFRVVKSALFDQGTYSYADRNHVLYTMFIDPPLSRVGMTAKEAEVAGHDILQGEVDLASHPRAHVNNDLRGLFKAVVDKKTQKILGVSLFGAQSEEIINLVKLAMDQDLDYTVLRDQMYNHPVMSEVFNTLFDVQ